MNILASYNWMKEFIETKLSSEEFAKLTTASGNSVERADHLAQRFDKMVVGLVKSVETHPNADKLKVAKTDIGTGIVDIVCGGANLAEGQRVVVGLPGAKVRWHGEGDLIELVVAKIRGVESYGMICAAAEIGFEKLPAGDHDIWDITSMTEAKAGTPIAQALELDDVIFDIEVTSNRPDCYSIVGQAREGAAVTGDKFVWESVFIKEPAGKTYELNVDVQEPDLCPKYSAIVIDNVKVGPSPGWLQKKLLLAGHRPINNIVDITNLVLHEQGQPLHAFDADKLEGDQIIVRKAKKGESFAALDGKTYELSADQLVIADAKRPVAVAGVMGGQDSGTTEATTRVVIEAATFDPVSVRRTARALTLYSDSQLLFEKGLSTEATLPALARAVELILEMTDGVVASQVITKEAKPYEPIVLPFDPEAAQRLMGIEMSRAAMVEILERLGFIVDDQNMVTVPYWRDHDIEHSVDFVEEIARVYGYDRFPSVLPTGELPVNRTVPAITWTRKVKELLSGMGATELYAYSFISEKQLERYRLPTHIAVPLKNPLSEELAFMRPSLVPSMLTTIEENQARISDAVVFELAPTYYRRPDDDELARGPVEDQPLKKEGFPGQSLSLVLASYGKDGRENFARAKGLMERLFRQTGIQNVTLTRDANAKRWHPGRSATISVDGVQVGTIGQVSDEVAKAFKLDVSVVLVELHFELLVGRFALNKSYTPITSFPAVKRDLAFVIDERIEFATVEQALRTSSTLLKSTDLFDVYRGKGVEEGRKSMGIHLTFQVADRTLEAKEVDEQLEQLRTVLQSQFSATMRS